MLPKSSVFEVDENKKYALQNDDDDQEKLELTEGTRMFSTMSDSPIGSSVSQQRNSKSVLDHMFKQFGKSYIWNFMLRNMNSIPCMMRTRKKKSLYSKPSSELTSTRYQVTPM